MIEFYEMSANYLDCWCNQFEGIDIFNSMLLRSQPSWEDVPKCIGFVSDIFPDNINDNELFVIRSPISKDLSLQKS